ncbi:MAG: hypothetical protein GY862_15055 [Gammaproteobacteria bacterium]|nr:hypothetical protein [Gammaproteobacteria bacterium]
MPEQQRYELTVTLEEDLHSGTGTGGKGLDAVQITGCTGKPVIRATHLKGLLRDAAMELLEMKKGTEAEINELFGERSKGRRGALILQSPRFEQSLEKQWNLNWVSTAREQDSRLPQEDSLRSAQYVTAGSVFKGEFVLLDQALEPLLKNCLKRTTHIGSSRSRDAGRVRITYESVAKAGAENSLESVNGRTRLRLVLRNLEPLNLPATGFPGNILPSECYIRGQRLSGALAGWAVRRQGAQEDNEAARLLLERKVFTGNAYPVPVQSVEAADISKWETIPFPLHIYTPKPSEGKVSENAVLPWWVLSAPGKALGAKGEIDKFDKDEFDKKASLEKPKRPGDREFLFRAGNGENGGEWLRYKPSAAIHMRNQVQDIRRNKKSELFAEEEIVEDSLFVADIDCQDKETAERFNDLFGPVLKGEEWLTLGRGGRPVRVERACWLDDAPVNEEGTSLQLMLTSDLIARSDENLGFYDKLDPCMLAELAMPDETERNALPFDDWSWQAVCDSVEVRGFNPVSGLPRAPALAIRRGSSILIQGPDLANLRDALAKLAKKEMGERAWEGFGRFTLTPVCWNGKNQESEDQGTKEKPEKKEISESSRQIGDDEQIMQMVLDFEKTDKPGKTQWQMLAELVREKRAEETEELIIRLEQFRAGAEKRRGGEDWKKPLNEIIKTVRQCKTPDAAELFLKSLARSRVLALKNQERAGGK